MDSDEDGGSDDERTIMLRRLSFLQAMREQEEKVRLRDGSKSTKTKTSNVGVEQLLGGLKFSDCQLVVSSDGAHVVHVIPAHRVILSQASPYFNVLLSSWSDSKVLVDPDLDRNLVIKTLEYIYATHGFAKQLGWDGVDLNDRRETCEKISKLFGLSQLPQAYMIASRWQLESLQKEIVLLLTPAVHHSDIRESVLQSLQSTGEGGPLELSTRSGAKITLSTCYDFLGAFSSDPAVQPLKDAVDAVLLRSLVYWKHCKRCDADSGDEEDVDEPRRSGLFYRGRMGDAVHCCSKQIDPLTAPPFEQIESAVKSVMVKLQLVAGTRKDLSSKVAKAVMQKEASNVRKEKARVPGMRDLPAEDREFVQERMRALSAEMSGVDRCLTRIQRELEESSEDSNRISEDQRAIVSPEGACVILDVLCGHYRNLRDVPTSYWALLLLAMDEKHLKKRLWPTLQQHGIQFDQSFWKQTLLVNKQWTRPMFS